MRRRLTADTVFSKYLIKAWPPPGLSQALPVGHVVEMTVGQHEHEVGIRGYLPCDGVAYPKADYPDLYAALAVRRPVGRLGRLLARLVGLHRLPDRLVVRECAYGERGDFFNVPNLPPRTHGDVVEDVLRRLRGHRISR